MNDKSERERYEKFVRRNILAAKNLNERKSSVSIILYDSYIKK